MRKTIKYYEVAREEHGVFLTKEIEEKRAVDFLSMQEVIGVKGKLPRVRDKVSVISLLNDQKIYGTVLEVSPDGVPVRMELDQGRVIELVGFVVELVNLVDVILRFIKGFFLKR